MLVVVVVAVVLVAVVVGGPSRDGIMMDPAIRSGQGGEKNNCYEDLRGKESIIRTPQ